MAQMRDLVEEICQKLDLYTITAAGHDLDKLTFEEFVKAQGKGDSALASATVWTRAMLGELLLSLCNKEPLLRKLGLEPHEISALFFLDYCNRGGGLLQMRSDKRNGGQYMRISQGTVPLHADCSFV